MLDTRFTSLTPAREPSSCTSEPGEENLPAVDPKSLVKCPDFLCVIFSRALLNLAEQPQNTDVRDSIVISSWCVMPTSSLGNLLGSDDNEGLIQAAWLAIREELALGRWISSPSVAIAFPSYGRPRYCSMKDMTPKILAKCEWLEEEKLTNQCVTRKRRANV